MRDTYHQTQGPFGAITLICPRAPTVLPTTAFPPQSKYQHSEKDIKLLIP